MKVVVTGATGFIGSHLLSSRKAGEMLGWNYLFDLEKGLNETEGWYETFCGGAAR